MDKYEPQKKEILINFLMDKEMADAMNKCCHKKKMIRSEFIRSAIQHKIDIINKRLD